jgi:hypothetical protein
VVFLGFSPLRCASRAIRLSLERADFWRWLFSYRHRSRPLLVQAIAAHARDADIQVLRTPRAIRRFIARVASGKPGRLDGPDDMDNAEPARRQGRATRGM